jgi:hypothetical protein
LSNFDSDSSSSDYDDIKIKMNLDPVDVLEKSINEKIALKTVLRF